MGGSVLIIDGDEHFAESAQNALEAVGITALVRPDASLDVVRSLRPHVLLMNVELPRGSGFSICSRIRRDKALRDTPILLTSSDTPIAALRRHAETPDRANDYATKPLEIPELVTRLQRLLALAPDRPEPEAPAAPLDGPPPMPVGAGPPPMPPKLQRTDGGSSDSIAGVQSNLQDDDLWPRERFEDAMRGQVSPPSGDIRLKGRSTPEERIEQLRQQVKQLESQRRAVQDAWGDISLRGQELARKVVALGAANGEKDSQLEQLEQNKQQTEAQLAAVENEFRAFQEEITRIFQEKDAEEQAKLAHLQQLEQNTLALQAQLQESQERQVDDERRLQIMQEELDFLQNEKDQFEADLGETKATLELTQTSESTLQARLSTTETVAAERADEIDDLRDKLDDLALETEQNRRLMQEQHAEQLAGLTADHTAELTALTTQGEADLQAERAARVNERAQLVAGHEAEVAQLRAEAEAQNEESERRHADLLDALSSTHEAEIEALTLERDAAQQALRSTADTLEATRIELETLRNDAEETEAQLRAELEKARTLSAQLGTRLETATAHNQSLQSERAELEQELDETADALREARTRVSDLQQNLDATRLGAQKEQTRLQELLDSEREASEEMQQNLHLELEQAQTELFERLSALDGIRADHHKLVAAHKQLGAQLETTALALEASEATLGEAQADSEHALAEQAHLQQQVERLEAQHARLETTVRESHQMLEEERARVRELEDQVGKGEELEVELRAELEDLQATVEADREALAETRDALSTHQRVGQQREAELAQIQAEREHIALSLDDESSARAELSAALQAAKQALQQRELELDALTQGRTDALRQVETTRREKDAEITRLNRAAEKASAEQARLQAHLEHERTEAARVHSEHETTQAQVLDLLQERDGVQAQARQLERDLRAAQRKVSALETQIEAHTAAAEDDTRAQIAGIERARDQAVAAAEAQLTADRKAGEDLRRALSALTIERDGLLESQAQLQRELERHSQLANQAVGSQGALHEEVELWQGHVNELKISVAELQDKLTATEEERDSLQQKIMTSERDAPLRRRLTAAEKEIRALRAHEKALGKRAEEAEEKVAEARFTQESIKSTLQAIERDLAQDQKHQKGFTGQYNLMLSKISRALALTLEVLEGADEDDDEIPLTVASDIFEYTGEVESLEPAGPTHSSPFPEVPTGPRTGGSAENLHALMPKPTKTREVAPDEPFADLVRELRAAAEAPIDEEGPPTYTGPRRGFDEAFAGEATTTDQRSISKLSAATPVVEEEEDERNVTEIIDLYDLE